MSLVLYERDGPVARIRLNRPDKLNAVNAEMLKGLMDALDAAESDPEIRVVLLSGEGRAFSAGFDLESGQPEDGESDADFVARELRADFDAIMRFLDCPKPVIAAVHGYCLGSAMEISAVCDVTIAAADCRFGAPEVRFGSGIVCLILPWVIGQKHARELLLTGSDRIGAERAERIGLVNRVVEGERLIDTALELADEIALNDPLAVQLTKKAINRNLDIAGLRKGLEAALEIDIEIETTETPESKMFNQILEDEGPKAALAWRARQVSPRRDAGSAE